MPRIQRNRDIIFSSDQVRLLVKHPDPRKIQYEFYKKVINSYFIDFSPDCYDETDEFNNDLCGMITSCPDLINLIPDSYPEKEELWILAIKNTSRDNFDRFIEKIDGCSDRVISEFIIKFRDRALSKIESFSNSLVETLDKESLIKIPTRKYTPFIKAKIIELFKTETATNARPAKALIWRYLNYHQRNTPDEVLLAVADIWKESSELADFETIFCQCYAQFRDEVFKTFLTIGIDKYRSFFTDIARDTYGYNLSNNLKIFAIKEEIKKYGMSMTKTDFNLISSILKKEKKKLSDPEFKDVVSDEFMCYMALKYDKLGTI